MELQIQDLISSIKKEGIERANKEAAAIVAEAEKQAEEILANANHAAEKVRENARREVQILKESARLDAELAKRDAVLAFRQEVEIAFVGIMVHNISKALNEKTMAALMLAAVKEENPANYTIEVKEVTDSLKGQLAEQLKNGLELRPSKKVQAGFRLVSRDGSSYLDCSDEEISKMLMPFLRDTRL